MMTDFMTDASSCAIVGIYALLANIPLGFLRDNSPKFSFVWFFWIQASIPFIIYLRMGLGTSPLFIPIVLALAVYGQTIGARWRRRTMTQEKWELLTGIHPSMIPKTPALPVEDTKIMVILLNMGGPRTNRDVPLFLKRLFNDVRLIRLPGGAGLQKIFASVLVKFRAKEAQRRYRLIGGGSPIGEATRKQAESLKRVLEQRCRHLDVNVCFNYSEPLPATALQEAKAANKSHILPLSLYPHYSSATTGSSLFHLKAEAAKVMPEAYFLEARPYYIHEGYIRAFVERIQEQLKEGESLSDFYLLFSAHGLPLYSLQEGDPYPFQVTQTVTRILHELDRSDDWALAYQSAVGPLQWLRPYTEDMIRLLAERGIKNILMVPVSFVTDHIETLCEIDIEYRQMAKDMGIRKFRMSRAIESHPQFIRALADAVERSLTPEPHKKDGQREGSTVSCPSITGMK